MNNIIHFIFWFLLLVILNAACALLFGTLFKVENDTAFIVLIFFSVSIFLSGENHNNDTRKTK